MLKYLIQKGYVNVSKLLLENYNHLNINEKELVVLLKLFELLKNNQTSVSVSALSKKMAMTPNELSDVLDGLFNRGLVTITVEYTKGGKAKEQFNLDDFISYLEQYFENEKNQLVVQNKENEIQDMVSLVEEAFKRGLTPLELQCVVDWVKESETKENVKSALAMATRANKLSIKYVDSCLSALKNEDTTGLTEKESSMLDDIIRKIR